jgi:hypothetical protein
MASFAARLTCTALSSIVPVEPSRCPYCPDRPECHWIKWGKYSRYPPCQHDVRHLPFLS